MNFPKVFVIIVSYNAKNWIYECIMSVIDSTYKNCEIVVVDNKSKDSTIQIITEKFQNVLTIIQDRNQGFGRGANVGIKYAMSKKAEYILLLNQDLWIKSDCIEKMINVCEDNINIGIATPLQMDYDGSNVDENFAKLYKFKSVIDLFNKIQSNESFEVDTVIGAAMLFRSDVFNTIGVFDPIYFLYHEEGDLCRRAKFHGFQIHVIHNAVVYHRHIQLFPKEMTFRAKFSSAYGYYIYILKNPFSPVSINFTVMFKSMIEWLLQGPNFVKICTRFAVILVSIVIVFYRIPLILNTRANEMISKMSYDKNI
ncbi:MAG: glycosyltransferase family 2 protein [Pseudomonadota bacterium]